MAKALSNKKPRYIHTSLTSNLELRDREKSVPESTETVESTLNDYAVVRQSASPHCTRTEIALVIVIIIALGIVTSLIVTLTTKKDDGDGGKQTTGDAIQATTSPLQETTGTTMEGNLWAPWEDWTLCTATCGSGIHKRYRSCTAEKSSKCSGNYVETKICTEATCPAYGKWTTWTPWSSCDVSCGGGTQTRARTCAIVDPTNLDCVGKPSQNKTCSIWECPDCSRTCAIGTLNTDCDTCICEGTTVTGRVSALTTGNPVSNAAFYASTAPLKVLTRSNSTGFFALNATCIATELLVVRDGFIDALVEVNNLYMEITMNRRVLPYLTEMPQSRRRLVGEDVSFCCTAAANPTIEYYEWLKEGILLKESLQNTSKLTLTNLKTNDSSKYQCRANSQAGAILSPTATLSVKEFSGDFCADALQQKTIALPDDCVQASTNTATFEVGECISKGCREYTTAESGTCHDETWSCCTVGEAVLETIQCSGYELDVIIVRACSCAPCTSNSLEISLTALGLEDGLPLKYGDVLVNGIFKGYTSGSGMFNFEVTRNSTKISIKLIDNFVKQYLPAVKIVEITDDLNGILHFDIWMIKAAQPVEIDSRVENTLIAGGTVDNATEPIIQISIPANAFYYINGTPYAGTVEASLTFLDPTNNTVLQNIPGVFQFVDEEGQTGLLASLGVFNLYFEDTVGEGLVLDDVADMYIPSELDEQINDQSIKLWKLNSEAGVWEYVTPGTGMRRRKRQVSTGWIGEIDWTNIDRQDWWNYDDVKSLTQDPCYFKVRLFMDQKLSENIANPIASVKAEYHYIRNKIVTSFRHTISYPENECLYAICENKITYLSLYYSAGNENRALFAALPKFGENSLYHELMDENKVLKIQTISSYDGPFYNDKNKCEASTTADSHLRYFYRETSEGYTFNYIYVQVKAETDEERNTQTKISRKTWFPNRPSKGYKACYMKVRFIFEGDKSLAQHEYFKLEAVSYGGTNTNIKNEMLGTRIYYIKTFEKTSSLCVEYKCSGPLVVVFADEESDNTKVELKWTHSGNCLECNVTEEADFVSNDPTGLNRSQLHSKNGIYELYAPVDSVPNSGLYSGESYNNDLEQAKTNSKLECRSGKSYNYDENNPDRGVAVTFSCKNK
ncbi:cartilage intermediate layer protein 1-like [Mercenaria mercenaria]|uniref:cartilage intermediate layer protein 1-like n=1 Tax=Mercenaria mercenaria TaxID=6596 RepID=UPI00234EBEFB|nr:cartilage intermediate layer protein 1-like [Mercenaria mercenaria]